MGQRVVDIHHLQDARQQGNFDLAETVGIPGSVPPFMVMADQRQHPAQRFQRSADLFAAHRMGAHDFPLRPGQFAGFEEHRIGDAYFADVVQVASHIKQQEAGTVQLHRHPKRHARKRQTLAMTRRMTVPLFHHPCKRVQHPLHFAERHGADQRGVRPWDIPQAGSAGAIADCGAVADCGGGCANCVRLTIRRQLLSECVHDASLYIGRVFGNNRLLG